MSRKEKLNNRAWRYGVKLDKLAVFGAEVGMLGFEAGYRAAMRDARKASKADGVGLRRMYVNLRQWMRPIS